MIYAVTYTNNVQALVARGLELCAQGKYKNYMRAVSSTDDNDGRPDGIALQMAKVDTAYAGNYPANLASLCLLLLPIDDIIGRDGDSINPEPYIGFCADVGLTVLAHGSDCYEQIKNNPASLALYRNVLPDREVMDYSTDENGIGTGVFEFNRWIEFDAPIRN